MQKARRIAAEHGLKYIPVHHMEAHALIARAGTAVSFPYLCLLVSGGHNMIVIVEGVGAYTLLGSTLDDAVGERMSNPHSSFLTSSARIIMSRTCCCCLEIARNVSHASAPATLWAAIRVFQVHQDDGIFHVLAGEAYDKVARLLGLDLNPSGGAAVEALAREGDDQRFKFSVPLKRRPNCNFSYAGLKTAVRLAIEAQVQGPPTDANRQVTPHDQNAQGHVIMCCLLFAWRSTIMPCSLSYVRLNTVVRLAVEAQPQALPAEANRQGSSFTAFDRLRMAWAECVCLGMACKAAYLRSVYSIPFCCQWWLRPLYPDADHWLCRCELTLRHPFNVWRWSTSRTGYAGQRAGHWRSGRASGTWWLQVALLPTSSCAPSCRCATSRSSGC